MAARLLLNRLEAQGRLQLPARQKRGGRRRMHAMLAGPPVSVEPINQPLASLQPLSVRVVPSGHPDRARLVHYLAQHHYLGYPHPLGQLHYLVRDAHERDLAVLLFGPAAWKCQGRDLFIGWTAAQRAGHLNQVASNGRFLILPWVVVPRLASQVLAMVLRRLAVDWQAHTGAAAVLAESFVEADRFSGTAYRASNWIDLGLTQGRSRHGRPGLRVPIKRLFVRPLRRRFRQELGG